MYTDIDQLPKKIPTPRDQWLDDFRRGPMTVIVWLLACLVAGVLLTQRSSTGELRGLAVGPESSIRATSDGIVEDILVDLFQDVEAGQAVALLNAAELDARLGQARANLESLQTQLRAAEIRLATVSAQGDREWNADWREETRLRVDVLELEVALAEDRVEAERLALQIKRQRGLHESGIVSAADLEDLELQHERLLQRIQENEKLLHETGNALSEATVARQDLISALPEAAAADALEIESMRLAAQAQRFELQELELVRHKMTLKAPISGQVRSIQATPGQSVLNGEPILQVAGHAADRVIVYFPELFEHPLKAEQKVIIAPRSVPALQAEARIERLSPNLEVLPTRLWRNATVPEYGRSALLGPTPGLRLAPGQIVTARLAP